MSVYNTIESNDNRILDKLTISKKVIAELQSLSAAVISYVNTKRDTIKTKVYDSIVDLNDNLRLNLLLDKAESTESEYSLAVTHILSDYYSNPTNESTNTKKYYSIIASENIAGKCNDILRLCQIAATNIGVILSKRTITGKDLKAFEDKLSMIHNDIDYAKSIEIGEYLERSNDGVCNCGIRMRMLPETSEMRCDLCMRTKKVMGTVLHYDADSQVKTKYNGYDIVRHLKFWLERLQALETKTFEPEVLERIRYVMKRDGIIKTDLTCAIMRKILKDPYVDATYLNDHSPLLVKTFGGEGPPTLEYEEIKVLTSRFIRAMNIHSDIHPESGNKPYYPHFIHKIAEVQFRNNPEKLRFLLFIHLQSPDTIEKNDKYFEEICMVVDDPDSGLVYTPTNPAGRF